MIPRDRAAALALALVGSAAVWQAARLPYWVDQAPGPGFLPFWLGALLVATSAAQVLWGTEPDPVSESVVPRRAPTLFAVTALAAAVVPIVGFSLAVGFLTGAAVWTLDRDRPLQAAAAAVAMPIVVWLVFVRWLEVPFPR